MAARGQQVFHWFSVGISFFVELQSGDWSVLSCFAEADAEDFPRPSSSLVPMKLRASSDHFSPSIPFVDVDEVGRRIFDFLHVDIRSEAEDVSVVGCQHS